MGEGTLRVGLGPEARTELALGATPRVLALDVTLRRGVNAVAFEAAGGPALVDSVSVEARRP
jgi:hypothetical protein